MGSGKRLWHSIRKHGKENHVCEIQEHWFSRKDLAAREKELVNEDVLKDDMCMNLRIGGESPGFINDEIQLKRSIAGNRALLKKREKDQEYALWYKECCSVGQKNSYILGNREKFYFYDWNGKKHKPETIEKIKLSLEGKQEGEKNSQFGTCWIRHLALGNKKIKKEELEYYLEQGWMKGRKIK